MHILDTAIAAGFFILAWAFVWVIAIVTDRGIKHAEHND